MIRGSHWKWRGGERQGKLDGNEEGTGDREGRDEELWAIMFTTRKSEISRVVCMYIADRNITL